MNTEHYRGREQTAVKHQILERYLKAFTPIIATWASEIVYLDCLAGPWNAKSDRFEDTSFGRAIKVFHNVRREGKLNIPVSALLVENNPAAFSNLKRYCESVNPDHGVAVTPENWDFEKSVTRIADFARKRGRNAFAFSFIDPKGWKLAAVDLIRPLLTLDPGEVLITFMSSWIERFLKDENKTAAFERLLGDSYDVARLKDLEGEQLEHELIATYVQKVRKAGNFRYVCALPVMMPDRDQFHFHMIYGTRHDKGLEEFKDAERVTIPFMHELRAEAQRRKQTANDPQGFLLLPSETYRERRFSRFHESAIARAEEAVRTKLKIAREGVPFRDLANEGMQFSTVLKEDVRDWIMRWKEAGYLVISQWNSRQRVPHDDQIVRWTMSNRVP